MTLPPTGPLAEAVSRSHLELARLHVMDERWHWLLLAFVCLAVLTYVAYMVYRDGIELPRGVTCALLLLRVFAFTGILLGFLDLEKKTQRELIKSSRVLLVVDTSQSMGLPQTDRSSSSAVSSRIQTVASELAEGNMIGDLRKNHDVVVLQFDEGPRPTEIASFAKHGNRSDPVLDAQASRQQVAASLEEVRILLVIVAGLVTAALVLVAVYFYYAGRARGEAHSWTLFAGVVLLMVALVTAATANLRNGDITLTQVLGWELPTTSKDHTPVVAEEDTGSETGDEQIETAGLRTQLMPRGNETRLGDNLVDVVNRERGGSIAGVAVFTDGQINAGVEYSDAARLAKDAHIPIYPIGMGSDRRPANVRLVDLEAPPRVFPGDHFPITGFIQAQGHGLEGRRLKVELVSAPADERDAEKSYMLEEERYIRLGSGNEVEPIEFEVTPGKKGRWIYRLRAEALEEDHDPRDNERTATVEIVQRKNHVLLFADGPTREFRFLRNHLYRDRDTTVDVYLQSAVPGISQDADEVLFEFPSTEKELFEKYDCIVAFDPDWLKLDSNETALLERWVAEKAGGLIVVAGPIHTPRWTQRRRVDERIKSVRALYPVVFDSWSVVPPAGGPKANIPWPLEFTREGLTSEFLWLDDDPIGSEQSWAEFDGVYGYYAMLPIKDVKPGATVYARFTDPETAVDDDLPAYLVGHFYGAGRVLFLGSGEMWRLRAVDEAHFEGFYTKLIRHVSQGRLLRDSSRGVLMVSKRRCTLGDTIIIRAHLTDMQHEPLDAEEVTSVLVHPDGTRQPIALHKVKDAPRPGVFAGQFVALDEGDYRVELAVPQTDDEYLARDVRVRVPKREIERSERDDAVLMDIARQTGGEYYIGMDAVLGRGGAAPLANVIPPNNVSTSLPDTPDTRFDRRLMIWLLAAICGALSLEWLFRRLSKLA